MIGGDTQAMKTIINSDPTEIPVALKKLASIKHPKIPLPRLHEQIVWVCGLQVL